MRDVVTSSLLSCISLVTSECVGQYFPYKRRWQLIRSINIGIVANSITLLPMFKSDDISKSLVVQQLQNRLSQAILILQPAYSTFMKQNDIRQNIGRI